MKKFLNELFCKHDWEVEFEEDSFIKNRRKCKKCNSVEYLRHNDMDGCWWETELENKINYFLRCMFFISW